MRALPRLVHVRPHGKIRRQVRGVEQEESSALAAPGEIAQSAAGVLAPAELVEEQGSAEQVPRGVLGSFPELARAGEEGVLVLQPREGEQERSLGSVGVARGAQHLAGVRCGSAVSGAGEAALRERLHDMQPADDLRVSQGERGRLLV